ncbi:MAG: HupE/UreJ family protein [Vicinamibacterales bacterium]
MTRALLATLFTLAALDTALAHDLERTTVHLQVDSDGTFTLRLAHDPSWLLLRMESFAGGVTSTSASDSAARDLRLRELASQIIDRVVLFVDGHEVRPVSVDYTPPPAVVPAGEFALASYTLHGQMPASSRTLRWYYGLVADPYPLTLALADGSSTTEVVLGDAWSTALPLNGPGARLSFWVRSIRYVTVGYRHILPAGFDHVLLIIGLCLLGSQIRPVLEQIAVFAVAHALVMALAVYGLVSVPTRSVEPLFGLMIAFVGIENVLTQAVSVWRVALVLVSGLVHGVGMAGTLTKLPLPSADRMVALIGVNVGIDAGQLTIVALVALVVIWWRNRSWYRARVVVPVSLAIAAAGLFWTVASALTPR